MSVFPLPRFATALRTRPALRFEITPPCLNIQRVEQTPQQPRRFRSEHTFSASSYHRTAYRGVQFKRRKLDPPLFSCQRQYSSASATTSSGATSTQIEPPSSTSSTNAQQRPSRTRRFLVASSLFLAFAALGFAMAAAPAAETMNGWANPPSDAETLSLVHTSTPESQHIENLITSHPFVSSLRQNPDFVESRPHMKIPPGMRAHNLTAGALMGPGKLEVPPLSFIESKAPLPKLVQIAYFGDGLCGHPGIVHGGLLATMLDEGLARCCFPALPNKVAVTASLKVDYRLPCPAGRLVVLKAETTKVEGRKAWVKGWIELLDDETGQGEGTKLVEAEALFIEPRHAKSMARVYSTQ